MVAIESGLPADGHGFSPGILPAGQPSGISLGAADVRVARHRQTESGGDHGLDGRGRLLPQWSGEGHGAGVGQHGRRAFAVDAPDVRQIDPARDESCGFGAVPLR